MLANTSLDLIMRDVFLELPEFVPGCRTVLKLEGHHITGSIKIKPAIALIEAAEARGLATPGLTTFIESSSGNLGVAMSCVCASKGYGFICVTDPMVTQANLKAIHAYGGRTIVVDRRDANGGFVGTRIETIRQICAEDPNCVWLNQYSNPANAQAHREQTAQEILRSFSAPEWLFIGVGTSGTFMGCAEVFKLESPSTQLVAVDPVGSVSFDRAPGKRLIPGIGASQKPQLLDASQADFVVSVTERDTIATCRDVARRYGILLGGSSGSTLAAIATLSPQMTRGDTLVVIAPDLGEKYLDTIYDDAWVARHFSSENRAVEMSS
ncbi:2,3-diaminopropionate biosynthesis protein SbnA [Pseudomonas sp. P9_31]|uniref:2,3-diaminopropionate biosynthesis protein SbnA n=1 Tax=Pseudomonas sp. P9_31 TaxID=3043448 RepID=UPI002A36C932|nr:2,3-diaminopropionate biosynthesis protein SbnA [Pseudomonas sp. P9_31]WPN60177.1 2,3-diaminopropionate biosynthesis protein SbnA [Pseudomonas sp. P9_31]